MPVNLSVKNVPDALAARLRKRAERNHRSLQGELMAILEGAASEAATVSTGAVPVAYAVPGSQPQGDRLVDRVLALAGGRGVEASKRLSRDEAHDRARLRKARP